MTSLAAREIFGTIFWFLFCIIVYPVGMFIGIMFFLFATILPVLWATGCSEEWNKEDWEMFGVAILLGSIFLFSSAGIMKLHQFLEATP